MPPHPLDAEPRRGWFGPSRTSRPGKYLVLELAVLAVTVRASTTRAQ